MASSPESDLPEPRDAAAVEDEATAGEDWQRLAWQLNADRSELSVRLPRTTYALDSKKLGKLLRFIAVNRSEMVPEQAATVSEAAPEEVYQADSSEFKESRTTSTVHVWSRVPGVGWVHLQLDAEPLREFATSVLSMIGNTPPVTSALN